MMIQKPASYDLRAASFEEKLAGGSSQLAGTNREKINANETVCDVWGQGKTKSGPQLQTTEWQWRQTLFDSFFGFFVNMNAGNDQSEPGYCKDDSKNHREFFKEITGEPNGQDSFTQVGNDFSYKFPCFIMQNEHAIDYHVV